MPVSYTHLDVYKRQELMRTDHAGFQIYDVDGDGQKEILVLQMAAGEVGQAESFVNSAPGSRVEVYNFRDGILELDASAPLSNGCLLYTSSHQSMRPRSASSGTRFRTMKPRILSS